jgi:hypothetical protein
VRLEESSISPTGSAGLEMGGSDYDWVGGVECSERRPYLEGDPNKAILILIAARLSVI